MYGHDFVSVSVFVIGPSTLNVIVHYIYLHYTISFQFDYMPFSITFQITVVVN